MNNKAHLRPKDYDSNGDIIPMACKEEKGDSISREALKKDIERYQIQWNKNCETDIAKWDCCESILAIIDTAPTVEIATKLQPNCNNLQPTQGEWIRLDLAKRVIAKFEGYLDEDMIYRIQLALEKENEADIRKGGAK